MVVIRLARGGSKKTPFYHVVACDKRSPRNGRYIESLGYFNPMAVGKSLRLELNQERITYWLKEGAQPSERVQALISEFTKNGGPVAARPRPVAPAKKAEPKVEEQAQETAASAAEETTPAADVEADKPEAASEDEQS